MLDMSLRGSSTTSVAEDCEDSRVQAPGSILPSAYAILTGTLTQRPLFHQFHK